MNAIDVLKSAKALISDPERWTQGVYARDRKGRSVLGWDESAACWCALGAVTSIKYHPNHPLNIDYFIGIAIARLNAAAQDKNYFGCAALNDGSDHTTVMDMFDRAIELERELHE